MKLQDKISHNNNHRHCCCLRRHQNLAAISQKPFCPLERQSSTSVTLAPNHYSLVSKDQQCTTGDHHARDLRQTDAGRQSGEGLRHHGLLFATRRQIKRLGQVDGGADRRDGQDRRRSHVRGDDGAGAERGWRDRDRRRVCGHRTARRRHLRERFRVQLRESCSAHNAVWWAADWWERSRRLVEGELQFLSGTRMHESRLTPRQIQQ